jgi:hypothetical protein
MVRRVSAVCWDGQAQVATRGVYVGGILGGGLWPLVGVGQQQATQISSLAAELAPPPGPPSRNALHVWTMVLGVYCVVTLAAVMWVSSLPTQPAPVPTAGRLLLSGCCMSPALVALAFLIPAAVRARRRDREWLQLLPILQAVWRDAWYCARCGGAFLDSSWVPGGGQSPVVDPPAFRDLVMWAGTNALSRDSRHASVMDREFAQGIAARD